MSKSKHRKSDEHLLGEVRTQRKQIKKLQQEIRRLQKELGYTQYKTNDNIYIEEVKIDQCSTCGKGVLTTLDLGIRKIVKCDTCTYKKVTK